jgi:cytidylate kinase
MYRAVTAVALDRGIDLDDHQSLARLTKSLKIDVVANEAGDLLAVDGQQITHRLRAPEVERGVSLVSKAPGVRTALVLQQRAVAEKGRVVMAGRDIGTAVLPDAMVKVFLKASVEVRARRRYLELASAGLSPDSRQVADDLVRRDMIDSERPDSPLRPAADAVQIDTDTLSIEQVADKILSLAGYI